MSDEEVVVSFGQAPAWCETHKDFAWYFPDGSGGCFYASQVEMGSSECRPVPLKPLQHAREFTFPNGGKG